MCMCVHACACKNSFGEAEKKGNRVAKTDNAALILPIYHTMVWYRVAVVCRIDLCQHEHVLACTCMVICSRLQSINKFAYQINEENAIFKNCCAGHGHGQGQGHGQESVN